MQRIEILEKIIEEQQKVMENIKRSVERYKTASDLDENDISDPDDLARQTEAKDMQLRYEKMLNKAKQNLSFVLGEKESSHNLIENGSLVETDKNYFFLGISVPQFKLDGKEIFCISSDAPIFAKLKGKKVGDQVQVGNNTFEIKAVQ